MPRRADVPDYAGEFIHQTARSIIEALIVNDAEHFNRLFPIYFEASFKEARRLLPKDDVADVAERVQRFKVATAPILDVLEISGYSIIVSELRQSAEMWELARALWDGYLVDKAKMDFLFAVLQGADAPAMFSRELVRIAWRQQIQGLIADVPREDEVLGSAGYGIHVEHRVKHPSVLIRQLGVDLVGSFYRGVDVFAAMYFVRLPGNENAARSLRSSGLIESLAHRSSRGRQAPREEGDEEATD